MDAVDVIQELNLMSTQYVTAAGDAGAASTTEGLMMMTTTTGPTGAKNESMGMRLLFGVVDAMSRTANELELPERSLMSWFTYLVSPFALLCIAMAVILNRTMVFATTRRPTQLSAMYRLFLRSFAIYSLLLQLPPLLTALKCTVPHGLGRFVPDQFAVSNLSDCPKPPILWNLYRSICLGHFIETFSSVIQGRIPHSETGMTLFEYSVAFQEVQSSRRLSFEILVVSLLSLFSQLTMHVMGIFNSYKYRLIPSAIFGISFLSFVAWSISQDRVFYFPLICLAGYLPQLIIAMIVILCGAIYGLACVFVGGPSNMQTSLGAFNLDLSEDFYSCLMKLGIIALTSVTKATYLTEAVSLSTPLATWVEGQYASTTRQKVENPYENEVQLNPVAAAAPQARQGQQQNEGQVRPGLMVVHRMMVALQMVHALCTIIISMAWRFLRDTFYHAASGKPRELSKEEAVEQEINQLRSHVIYAALSDDFDKHDGYLELLAGDLIPDIDDSPDYIPEDESDTELYEYESEVSDVEDSSSLHSTAVSYTKYLSDAARQRLAPHSSASSSTGNTTTNPEPKKRSSAFAELYDLLLSTPESLLSLLGSRSQEEAENARILSSHLTEPHITRSKYRQLHKNDDVNAVLELISERRHHPLPSDADQSRIQSVCVVCQTQPRQVVLWPCRCFALCEECRLGLAVKNFKGCVCCRREVESFSRVFVP